MGKILLCIVFVVFLITALGHSISTPPTAPAIKTPEQQQADLLETARWWCSEAIKKSLHDPDSAEFDERVYNFPTETKKNGNVVVEVSLRARNGFNAMRRFRVHCTFKKSGDDLVPVGMKEIN